MWATAGISHQDKELLEMFKDKIKARGARGMVGMQRTFKIADDDDSKSLDLYEFSKAIKDYRIMITKDEAERLFTIFDRDGSGTIIYDEFLRAVAGEMSQFRKNLVKKAFQKLDANGNGIIETDDIKSKQAD